MLKDMLHNRQSILCLSGVGSLILREVFHVQILYTDILIFLKKNENRGEQNQFLFFENFVITRIGHLVAIRERNRRRG